MRRALVLLGLAALAVQWAGAVRPPAVPDCPEADTGIVVEVDAEGAPTGRAVGVVGCHE